MTTPAMIARVHAGCPRWLSAQCDGGDRCACLPFRYDTTTPVSASGSDALGVPEQSEQKEKPHAQHTPGTPA
jgi:hypothetical protein